MMFIDRLVDQIKQKNSCVLVGLDPQLEYMPAVLKNKYIEEYGAGFKAIGELIIEFNKKIIDHVWDVVPAVKPQIAFYEQYGLEGLKAYRETCKYARQKGLLVIGDIKRGDIGSTSRAYSRAHLGITEISSKSFEAFSVDAITTNPYLGDDCLKEFMEDIQEWDKGMFVLVKTSNPSSGQFQDLKAGDRRIYEIVAEMVYGWSLKAIGESGYSSVGGVIGATHPREAKIIRGLMPKAYFLVPGYGAQGGSVEDIIDCFNEDGLGAIINSSRAIIYAYRNSEDFGENSYGEAARIEALKMRDSINKALEEKFNCRR
jgi:orotidine-5'-phosphate decarboxylase